VTTELAGEAGDLALGTYEATLMEMTAAYAALANRGARVIPYARRQRPALQTPRY
jgi:penicillin-binding protein 1A